MMGLGIDEYLKSYRKRPGELLEKNASDKNAYYGNG